MEFARNLPDKAIIALEYAVANILPFVSYLC